MKRRTVLHGVGGGIVALSGCSGVGTRESFVTDRAVTVTERGCEDRRNTATLDYDEGNSRLQFRGVLSETEKCGGLRLSHAYNSSSNRIVEVIPRDSEECTSCTRFYEYEASVSFRKDPSTVGVIHSDPDVLAGVGTLVLDDG